MSMVMVMVMMMYDAFAYDDVDAYVDADANDDADVAYMLLISIVGCRFEEVRSRVFPCPCVDGLFAKSWRFTLVHDGQEGDHRHCPGLAIKLVPRVTCLVLPG